MEKILIDRAREVAGGSSEENVYQRKCTKADEFKVLDNKQDEWKSIGCPKTCGYCWKLKYDGKYYC